MDRTAVAGACLPPDNVTTEGTSGKQAGTESVSIECYENDVPQFIEADMERLYGSMYSSLPQYRIFKNGRDTSTYIVREGDEIVTVYLFQVENGRVRVLNEVMQVSEIDVNRFAHYIFSALPTVSAISFKAVHGDIGHLAYPRQWYDFLEDIVLTLPASADDYLSMLSNSMRRHVRRYAKKLDEAFPAWEYKVYSGGEIDESMIRTMVELNRARMANKNKISAINDDEIEHLSQHARECGLVGLMVIDGKIRSGTLCLRVDRNYFLSVIAHDPKYDDYWLGTMGCYLIIRECIARGGKEFHFLWGQYTYKFKLMGVKRILNNLVVYRSRAHMLKNARVALSALLQACRRKMALWLYDAKNQDGVSAKLALVLLNHVRTLRRRKQDSTASRDRQ